MPSSFLPILVKQSTRGRLRVVPAGKAALAETIKIKNATDIWYFVVSVVVPTGQSSNCLMADLTRVADLTDLIKIIADYKRECSSVLYMNFRKRRDRQRRLLLLSIF